MSGASWKADPKLTRPKHKWKFSNARESISGASVEFYCENPGCATRRSVQCSPGEDMSGICFNRDEATQLTDKDGNPI